MITSQATTDCKSMGHAMEKPADNRSPDPTVSQASVDLEGWRGKAVHHHTLERILR